MAAQGEGPWQKGAKQAETHSQGRHDGSNSLREDKSRGLWEMLPSFLATGPEVISMDTFLFCTQELLSASEDSRGHLRASSSWEER